MMFRFRDINWSMEALTSLSFKGSLNRVDTFDDLSAIQCDQMMGKSDDEQVIG